MSLVDDLLDDLEDVEDEESQPDAKDALSTPSLFQSLPSSHSNDLAASSSATRPAAAAASTLANSMSNSIVAATTLDESSKIAIVDNILTSVANLRSRPGYKSVMLAAAKRHSDRSKGGGAVDPKRSGVSFDMVTAGTRILQDINHKITDLHRIVIDLYSAKFPDLPNLTPKAENYFRVVLCIGNLTDISSAGVESILPKNEAIRVVVSGSTSNDQPLPDDEMQRVVLACQTGIELSNDKAVVMGFITKGMSGIAPNVTALVGATCAAKLLGAAGGLTELSRIPGKRMMLLGQQRKLDLGGASLATARLHEGLVYQSPLVVAASNDLRKKCAKEVAFKVALMARVDANSLGTNRNSAQGEKFLAAIKAKYNKWEEPDRARTEKALPVPDAGEKKSRRGGRRRRAWKKKYGLTDVHKDANRIAFGSQADEYGDSAMGKTFGTLGQSGSGRVRQAPKVEQKVTLTKAAKRKLERANAKIKGNTANGLASSMMLESERGIEFVAPGVVASRKRTREASDRFFGSKSGFRSVVPRFN